MSVQEVKPIHCPFCGSENTKAIGSWAQSIKCMDCKAVVYFDDISIDLVAGYNKRAERNSNDLSLQRR